MTARRALLVFVALAAFHLWPLSAAPWRQSLNYNADAEYNAWAIAWINRTLPTAPTQLFDANMFAPEPATLAYSHPIVVPALIASPVVLLGGSPVFAFNVAVFVGLVLTAWCTWFVVRDWTGSATAALVSGALAAFNVHLLIRLPHVTAANAWGPPLALYFADRIARTSSWRDAIGLAAVVALTGATSLYWLAAVGVITATVLVVHRPGWRPLVTATAAWLAGLIALVPLLLPYLRMGLSGIRRPIEMVADFSATPAGYLASTSVVHRGWTAPFFRDEVNLFFAGFGALALALAGFVSSGRRAPRRTIVLIGALGVGVWLSLGPATGLYRWAYDWFLPLRGLRGAARFGYLYLLVIAIAAGFGLAWLESRVRSRRTAAAVVGFALLVVTAEAWHGPLRTQAFTRVPAIYELLADLPEPVALAEVPFYPPDAVHFNGEYVLNSTAHWRPLMNGTGGLTPMSYRERAAAFWFFPRDWAIRAMQDHGVTHVMVHLEKFEEHERSQVKQALLTQWPLRVIAADGPHRLYELLPVMPEPDADTGGNN